MNIQRFTEFPPLRKLHEFEFIPKQSGIVECIALARNNKASANTSVIISDLNDFMQIDGIDKMMPITVGDTVNLMCATHKNNSVEQLEWYRNGTLVKANNGKLIKLIQ